MMYCILPCKITMNLFAPTLPRNFYHLKNHSQNELMKPPRDASALLAELAGRFKANFTSNINSVGADEAPVAPPVKTDKLLPASAGDCAVGGKLDEELEVDALKVEESASGSEDEAAELLLRGTAAPVDAKVSRNKLNRIVRAKFRHIDFPEATDASVGNSTVSEAQAQEDASEALQLEQERQFAADMEMAKYIKIGDETQYKKDEEDMAKRWAKLASATMTEEERQDCRDSVERPLNRTRYQLAPATARLATSPLAKPPVLR